MTDADRIEALEAVEAAAVEMDAGYHQMTPKLRSAIAAFKALAHPAAPTQGAVTLAVWALGTGEVSMCEPGSELDRMRGDWPGQTRLGTVTLPLATEAGDGR